MSGNASPQLAPGGGRVPLARSFAFRLGAAFAVVAIAGAGVTALVVNAAFGARFNRYLAQQRHAQVTSIATAASRTYTGNGKWDLHALETLVPAVGSGTVRIVTPSGHDVWQWDGHSMNWNDQWMDDDSGANGHTSSGQHSSGDCGGWDSCSSWDSSGSSRWDSGSGQHGGGWHSGAPAAGQPGAPLLAAAAPQHEAVASPPPGLGSVQQIPIKSGGKVVGTALVRLPAVTALPEAVRFRGEVIGLVLAAGAAGALMSLALGIVFARRATRPVRQVTATARALAAGDRRARLDVRRADEFGQMSAAFNAMADAAEDQEKLRQSFAAQVAHELRTPLTILRSQVEGLQVGVLQPDAAALASLEEEVRRMARLVADLQILGSADAAGFSLERAPTDLGKLAEEAAREFAGLFEGAGIALQTRLEAVTAWADRIRVGQILANLLSNALKFIPAGGLARLEVTAGAQWAVIRVSDTGPGIPADELPHVFDRFFRGRTARPSGSGIGLTVVRELAEAHGGTAEVSSQPGQGATFTVRLPAQPNTAAQPLPHRFFTAAS